VTEEEYCNLTDMQLARASLRLLEGMFCFDDQNQIRLLEVRERLLIIATQENIRISDQSLESGHT